MAAIAAHHWVLLVLIASAAGEVPRDPTTAWNAATIKLVAAHPPLLTRHGQPSIGDWAAKEFPATIKLIAAHPPLLTHHGQPSIGDWAAEEFPATAPYRAAIAEGVNCQLNSCCNYTSKTLPLPPSSIVGQGMGEIQAATTLNSVGRKPGNTSLARPATNGQPHEMTAHREPRPTRRPHGESPSRKMRAINNSAQSSLNPYTTAQPNGCCFLGPPCYRRSEGEMRAISNSTQSSFNPCTTAQPNGYCFLGPPCYRRSEGTCVIRSKAHRAPTPAKTSVWPECSEHAAHCLYTALLCKCTHTP